MKKNNKKSSNRGNRKNLSKAQKRRIRREKQKDYRFMANNEKNSPRDNHNVVSLQKFREIKESNKEIVESYNKAKTEIAYNPDGSLVIPDRDEWETFTHKGIVYLDHPKTRDYKIVYQISGESAFEPDTNNVDVGRMSDLCLFIGASALGDIAGIESGVASDADSAWINLEKDRSELHWSIPPKSYKRMMKMASQKASDIKHGVQYGLPQWTQDDGTALASDGVTVIDKTDNHAKVLTSKSKWKKLWVKEFNDIGEQIFKKNLGVITPLEYNFHTVTIVLQRFKKDRIVSVSKVIPEKSFEELYNDEFETPVYRGA